MMTTMIPLEQLRPPVYALVEADHSAPCRVACRRLIELYKEDMIRIDWYGFDNWIEAEEEIKYLKDHYDKVIIYDKGEFKWYE